MKKYLLVPVLILWAVVAAETGDGTSTAPPSKPKLAVAIKPKHVTDALRAVILSDREVYLHLLASQNLTNTPASAWPSPCEQLRLVSQKVASQGVEFSYVLRSTNPINRRNAPETEVETKGLQFVGTRPDLVYTSDELLGGRWYFTAIYPDVAAAKSCVACHNAQRIGSAPAKIGDVIGALVIRVALEL